MILGNNLMLVYKPNKEIGGRMKKVLSVFLVLGLLLSVSFAAEKSEKSNVLVTTSSLATDKKADDSKLISTDSTKATIDPDGTIHTGTNEVVHVGPDHSVTITPSNDHHTTIIDIHTGNGIGTGTNVNINNGDHNNTQNGGVGNANESPNSDNLSTSNHNSGQNNGSNPAITVPVQVPVGPIPVPHTPVYRNQKSKDK